MHDLEGVAGLVRRFVRSMQPMEHAAHHGCDDLYSHCRALGAGGAHEAGKGLARHVLHHEEQLALRGDDVDRRHDVRMTNAGCEPRLVDEHCDELLVLRVLRMEAFDGHGAREPHRAVKAPVVHRSHPTSSDLAV